LSCSTAASRLQVKVVLFFDRFPPKKEAKRSWYAWYWRCQQRKIYNSGVETAYFCGIFGTRGQERRDAQAAGAEPMVIY